MTLEQQVLKDLKKAVKHLRMPQPEEDCILGFIKFNYVEIARMNLPLKREIKTTGCCAVAVKHRCGGSLDCYYEIRYRRNGYNITVFNPDLKTAKELFIKAT